MVNILPLHKEAKSQQHTQEMIEHPKGFSELAFLISTDQDFSIFRKFDELSALNLLQMQSRLTVIENELRALDQQDLAGGVADTTRKEVIILQVDVLLKKYRMRISSP